MSAEQTSSPAEGAAAPPAADTAATPSPQAADAPQSAPAAAPGPEAAASTGDAQDGPGATSLEDLFEKYTNARADADADPAAQAAPEGQQAPQDEAAEEPEGDAEGQEGPAATTPDEVDPLAEFDEPKIPTRDDINDKWKRTPQAMRDEFADVAEQLAEAQSAVSGLGGKEGLEVAKAIVPHLFAVAPSEEAGHAIFEAMVEANPGQVAVMGQLFVQSALNDEKTGAEFGDRLLTATFGEGYDAERLARLVEYDKAGLIDHDFLSEDLEGAERVPTAREAELEKQVGELSEQVKTMRGESESASAEERGRRRFQDTVKKSVSEAVMPQVLQAAKKIGWEGDGLLGTLGRLASAELNQQIEETPEFREIMELAEAGNAYRGGEPTRAMRVKLEAAGRRGLANFLRTARELAPVVKMLAGQQSPQSPPAGNNGRSEAPGGAHDAPPPPAERPAPQSGRQLSTQERLDEAFRRRQAAARDQEALRR